MRPCHHDLFIDDKCWRAHDSVSSDGGIVGDLLDARVDAELAQWLVR